MVFNDNELAFYLGLKKTPKSLDEIAKFAKKLLENGPRGSIAVTNKKIIKIKDFKVKAVDTTVAGDSFVGAFVTKLINGESLEQSLEFVNLVASKVVHKIGASSSLPYLHEVEN